MSKCPECDGTRLQFYGEYKHQKLYTNNECLKCGGKGYEREGEEEYVVGLFADEVRIYQFFVLARTAAEALFLASEMFVGTAAGAVKPGQEVALTVEER